MTDFLKYFFEINPSFFACLFNLGVAAWVFAIGIKTHIQLTDSYYSMPKELQQRKSAYRPICVQAVRAAILYAFVYSVDQIFWIAGGKWGKIGETEDLLWSIVEFTGFYAIILWLRLGRMVAVANRQERKKTECK